MGGRGLVSVLALLSFSCSNQVREQESHQRQKESRRTNKREKKKESEQEGEKGGKEEKQRKTRPQGQDNLTITAE